MDVWTIGFADRCTSPRFSSKLGSGEMLAFAHIPTGPTADKGLNIDEVKKEPLHQLLR
jgi:hypothetical protein